MLAIALDILLLALSCFGYLLKPHLSRALSRNRRLVRLGRACQSAWGQLVGLVGAPLNWWTQWRLNRLSGPELVLLRFGRSIEQFCDANGGVGGLDDLVEDDDDGDDDQEGVDVGPANRSLVASGTDELASLVTGTTEKEETATNGTKTSARRNPRAKINNDQRTLFVEPALILEAVGAYYSNKLSPASSPIWSPPPPLTSPPNEMDKTDKRHKEGKEEGESSHTEAKEEALAAPIEFRFVTRDDPIVCSINWMNCDLICFRSERASLETSPITSSSSTTRRVVADNNSASSSSAGGKPNDECQGEEGRVIKATASTDSSDLDTSGDTFVVGHETTGIDQDWTGGDKSSSVVAKQTNGRRVIAGGSTTTSALGASEWHSADDGDDVTKPEQIVDNQEEGWAKRAVETKAMTEATDDDAPSSGSDSDELADRDSDSDSQETTTTPPPTAAGRQTGIGRYLGSFWYSFGGEYLNETHNNSERVRQSSDSNHDEQTAASITITTSDSDADAHRHDATGPSGQAKLDAECGRQQEQLKQQQQQQQQQQQKQEAPIWTTLLRNDQLMNVRPVWLSESGETASQLFLIQLKQLKQQQQKQQQQQQCQAPSGSTTTTSKKSPLSLPPSSPAPPPTMNRTFCLAEFYTRERLLRLDARSSLIFYLIQLYPNELVPLYKLISQLLARAGLIQPSGYSLFERSTTEQRPEHEDEDSNNSNNKDAAHDDDERRWLELIGWDLGVDSREQADGGAGPSAPRRQTNGAAHEHEDAAAAACQLDGNGEQWPHSGQHRLIDRYALVLMIAAHLERERGLGRAASGKTASWNDQIRLASSLAGFFECYSSSSSCDVKAEGAEKDEEKCVMRPPRRPLEMLVHDGNLAQRKPGAICSGTVGHVRMEIEFVGNNNCGVEDDNGDYHRNRSRLIVLDPIEFRLNNSMSLGQIWTSGEASGIKREEELAGCEANLTAGLMVWDDVCELFADCHALITDRLETASSSKAKGRDGADQLVVNARADNNSVLSGLFELAERSRSKQRCKRNLSERIGQILSKQSTEEGGVTLSLPVEIMVDANGNYSTRAHTSGGGGGGGKFVPTNQSELIGGGGKQQRSLIGNTTCRLVWTSLAKLNKLRANKLIRALFWLALFLLMRVALTGYLDRLHNELMFESRGDFIALKRMIFPEGFAFIDEEDEGDGITILSRDEKKEQEAPRGATERGKRETEKKFKAAKEDERIGKVEEDTKTEPTTVDDQRQQAVGEGGEQQEEEDEEVDEDDMNKVMETLLTGLLSQAFGDSEGSGMGDGSSLANMSPEKLAKMMKMFTEAEGGGKDGEPIDEKEMAEMMKTMEQVLGGAGGIQESASGMPNIDTDDNDYDYEDDDEDDDFDAGATAGSADPNTSEHVDEARIGTSDEL